MLTSYWAINGWVGQQCVRLQWRLNLLIWISLVHPGWFELPSQTHQTLLLLPRDFLGSLNTLIYTHIWTHTHTCTNTHTHNQIHIFCFLDRPQALIHPLWTMTNDTALRSSSTRKDRICYYFTCLSCVFLLQVLQTSLLMPLSCRCYRPCWSEDVL